MKSLRPRSLTRREALVGVFAEAPLCTFTLHHAARMRGEGLLFPNDACLEDCGFVVVNDGRVFTYWHPAGQVWTEDADGWVCDVSVALAQTLDSGELELSERAAADVEWSLAHPYPSTTS